MGVEPIVAADFSPARRALAKKMGAHEAVDPREEPAIDAWNRVDGTKPLVIFEAVGVPGMLDQAMRAAPRAGRVMVVGACMENDTVRPLIGIGKELEIRFALGYDPMEFGGTLRAIAEGEIDVVPLITGAVGIDGVPASVRRPREPGRALQDPGRAWVGDPRSVSPSGPLRVTQLDDAVVAVDGDRVAVLDDFGSHLRPGHRRDPELACDDGGVLPDRAHVEDDRAEHREDRRPVGAGVLRDEDLAVLDVRQDRGRQTDARDARVAARATTRRRAARCRRGPRPRR